MPYSFFLNYETIAKFQLYKYVFHAYDMAELIPFSEFKVSKEIKMIQERCRDAMGQLNNFQYILDKRLFLYLAEDVAQFRKMGLLKDFEAEKLKDDIQSLLRDLETVAITGLSIQTQRPTDIFISNMHFDTSYILYQSEDYEIAHFRLFTINGIRSDNNMICQRQKNWLESLKQIFLSISFFSKKTSQSDTILITHSDISAFSYCLTFRYV